MSEPHAPLNDVIGWDIPNWSMALPYWERHLGSSTRPQTCLELGCGQRSSLSLWLAMRGHRVLCSDQGGVAEVTRAVHARYRVDGQIFYESIDARAIPYVAAFDIVVFKSMLGGVGGNGTFEIARKVIDQTYRALRPGGLLLFAENLAATALHQLARTHFAAGKLGWRYFTVAEIREMVAEFSVVDYMTCGFLGCFGRSESQRNLLGRLDRALLGRLVPRDWRYIMIVAARK